jgi:hypothetical protein
MGNFVTKVLNAGGSLHPLIVPVQYGTNGTALFNPSVYKDGDEILCNVRHCQYTLFHAEKSRFEHQWGPLNYLCPEDDLTLTTTNYLFKLNPETLETESIHRVDTSKLDVKPIWEFVGLEDARVFRWGGKLYYCGVRRDTTPNGVGRMELSEVVFKDETTAEEVSRWRIPAPPPDNTYCEKNWMPILDMPWHFVKWSNPTEIVKVNPVAKTCETVFMGKYVPLPYDYRGGSHVIPFGEHRIAISHLLTKFHKSPAGRKNAQYRHAFLVWDKDWNVVKYGDIFSFMDSEVEFCVGMAEHGDDFLISFGFQDNSAYLLRTPRKIIEEYVYG